MLLHDERARRRIDRPRSGIAGVGDRLVDRRRPVRVRPGDITKRACLDPDVSRTSRDPCGLLERLARAHRLAGIEEHLAANDEDVDETVVVVDAQEDVSGARVSSIRLR